MNTEKILKLVNSEEINDWYNLFNKKIKQEQLKNSKQSQLYRTKYKDNNNFQFVEELELLYNILPKLDEKLRKKYKIRDKIAKNINSANESKKEKLINKYEKEMQIINDKIQILLLFKEEKIEKVKKLELKRCELLTAEFKNKMKGLSLSKEDREIRDIENKIWKIILDDYFQNKNHRILKLNEYSAWFSEFEIKLREIKANGTVCEKRVKVLTNIAKTLYMDVKRDKSFLESENIETDGFEDISLNSFDDEGIGESINSTDLQNQPSTSGYKPKSPQM
ncbi:hypothetical protein [Spiroplasma endosymbiont of Danaus chrysippus]|uniref:hypothetical protein n=1 Tax=Spiroplasma endosymbiont of Danaus chrysippus TaxID=2691041 RepID=UPI00157BA05D|nr:hypothetical protein [Spiroplasma endosymbiont of Danaus chrysippus]